MFRWKWGLYGIAAFVLALGFYWRIRGNQPPGESSLAGEIGETSSASHSIADQPRAEGTASLEPRAARRVRTPPDSSARLILAATDRTTGSPIPDAAIALYQIDPRNGTETEYASAYADSRGEVGFSPPEGNYVVAARHRRYAALRESVDVRDGGSVRVELSMVPAIGVSGEVTDYQRRPRPHAAITFTAAGTTSEASSGVDGSFETWLQPGRYKVVASDSDSETTMHGVDIWPGRDFFLEIKLGEFSPSTRFTGTVAAAHGAVSDAVVQVRTEPGRQPGPPNRPTSARIDFFHSALTASDGGFSLNLPPMKVALVTISASGHETLRQRVEVGGSASRDFWLQEERGFHLKVIDGRGNVVPGVEIVGLSDDGRRVVRNKGRFVYASSEYPFKIYAVDRRSGLRITGEKRIDAYQPEILLDSPGG